MLFLARLAFALLILGGLTFYVWRRLVQRTGMRGGLRLAATLTIVALPLPFLVVILTGGNGPPEIEGAVAWPAFLGWALIGLLAVGLLAVDIVRLVLWTGRKVARRSAPTDPSRREAIARITGGLVAASVVGEVAVGLHGALAGPHPVDVPVTLPRLARSFDGFTIAQLTDLHIGGTIGRDYVAEVVRRTNAMNADLVAVTGDMVDGTVARLRDAAAPLGGLRAPHGVFFVTGNHEYYSGVEPWLAHFASLGMRVLRNQRVEIRRGDDAFDLVGIDDHDAKRFGNGHGADLAAALAGRDPSRPVVLLAHQPRQVVSAAQHHIDLQLSGHTHGGQVWPWHALVALQQGGRIAGRYREGATQLYVSRGAGHWGPPMRFGAPSELTRIILRT